MPKHPVGWMISLSNDKDAIHPFHNFSRSFDIPLSFGFPLVDTRRMVDVETARQHYDLWNGLNITKSGVLHSNLLAGNARHAGGAHAFYHDLKLTHLQVGSYADMMAAQMLISNENVICGRNEYITGYLVQHKFAISPCKIATITAEEHNKWRLAAATLVAYAQESAFFKGNQ
jgi:hypothetical protein